MHAVTKTKYLGHPEKLPKDFRKMSLSDKLIKLQKNVSVNLIAFFWPYG